MFRSKKVKRSDMDQELLNQLFHLKKEWVYLEDLLNRSIEPSESGQFDLAITKAKYFYLLREAKVRNLSAIK
ncbi:YaaL family protein [Gracilibacillus sp. S3-1-1]|uniref:YaaL family protein n=1 Tax=Gracilibacillus pellucidus TaxID=3095368 RepID=A0ACC6M3F8_9BACI|nr:YaaL family protein [Gracilibacillus sp. S3-1-1]MDX8045494.1 YaaL family protein [Gracilibacillus sp. S3-1-1]